MKELAPPSFIIIIFFFLYSINNKYVKIILLKKILKFIRSLLDETLREINEIYARINFPKQKGKQAMQVKESRRQKKRRYIILSAYSCVRALNLCCRPLHTINGTGTVYYSGEIYTNSHKIFGFFHLNPLNKFLSTLAIKESLRPKYPSLSSLPQHSLSHISPKPNKLPSSSLLLLLPGLLLRSEFNLRKRSIKETR